MSDTPLKYLQMLKKKAASPEESNAPDERDRTIERLERELAEEAEHTTDLRKAVDELRFKIKTLEKSYVTQLEDAKQRIAYTELTLEEEKAKSASVQQERDDLQEALDEAGARIERLTAGADLVTSMNTRPGAVTRAAEDETSIDKILADSSIAGDSEKAAQKEHAIDEPEEPAEDMLPPDLVFAAKQET